MPNYSLETSLRSFDPTRLAFLAEMQSEQTKSLREAQAAYSELMSEANLYDKLANDVMGTNSQAYRNAKSYADALRQHTDLLATQGLTASTMRNLMMARTDAARIINPIKEGLERRQKIADYQKEYNEKHPEALWERDVSQMGIDQIMKNPNYTPKVIDRKELANRAKERYEALKNQLMEFYAGNKDMVDALSTKDPRVAKQWYKTNAPWYWEAMEKYGMNPADVHKLLAGDPSMEGTLLKNIADETLRMSGFDSWNTDYDHYTPEQNAQNRANLADQVYMSILPEATNSINKTDFKQYQNNLDAQIIMEREGNASRERIAKWNLDYQKEKDAAAKAGQDIQYANMIRTPSMWDDNAGGKRMDDIKEATNLLIYKQLGTKYDKIDYDDLNDAVTALENKGISFQKGADNTKFLTLLKNTLDKKIQDAKQKTPTIIAQYKAAKNRAEIQANDAVNIAVRQVSNMANVAPEDILYSDSKHTVRRTPSEIKDWINSNGYGQVLLQNIVPKDVEGNNGETNPLTGANRRMSQSYNQRSIASIIDSYTNADNQLTKAQGLVGKYGYLATENDNNLDNRLSNYENQWLTRYGYKGRPMNVDGKTVNVYFDPNGQQAREGILDDVLNYNSDVHRLDFGTTVMNKDVSQDMALKMFSTEQGGNIINGGKTTNGLIKMTGVELPAGNDWGDPDSNEFNKHLSAAREGKEWMNLTPFWDEKQGTFRLVAGFYPQDYDPSKQSDEDTGQDGVILYGVNPEIFGMHGSYRDANGNLQKTNNIIKSNMDVMDQTMKVYTNPTASEEDRRTALSAFMLADYSVFGNLNAARQLISDRSIFGSGTQLKEVNREQADVAAAIDMAAKTGKIPQDELNNLTR